MTLLVNTFVLDANGDLSVLDPAVDAHELAGFEACRTTLYSSPVAKAFDLALFPLLATQDLYVLHEDVDRLQHEAQVILQHVGVFAGHVNLDTSYVIHRIENILHAIEQAKRMNGGVVIW